jgi:hypothetical protein
MSLTHSLTHKLTNSVPLSEQRTALRSRKNAEKPPNFQLISPSKHEHDRMFQVQNQKYKPIKTLKVDEDSEKLLQRDSIFWDSRLRLDRVNE